MRRLELLYALVCAIWAAWFIRGQVSFYLSNEGATWRGPALCIAAFVFLPVILGYLLLFQAFPWLNRLVRR